MKTNSGNPYVAPFLLWQAIGARTFELMLASAQVIAQRTSMMAQAGSSPSPSDRREFTLMVQEKADAGVRSAVAMTTHLASMGPLFGAHFITHALRTSAAMMALANSRTLGQSLSRQAALARTLQSRRAQALSADVARLVDKGLKPFHVAAVSNVKRLAKRDRRA